ncbi:N-acetylmuramoyl-L-alanine amidase [uncultured Phocaeicola sp.]|uniref:N-acetylmuramoyl-L-alanine amidase n=1 Tax=uncultured Phocaeicola sp. TaxID=990718 RepID=UPI00258F7B5D|nr:N-acetylmuramoyl-L-alanine amidase [uncultured Phocaeicola sp.]
MEREVNLIVVHCSATRVDRDITARDIDSFHRVRGFSSWGYHYYVRKDGSIEKMRDESEPGAHAYGHNRDSIGLCYEGGLDVNGRPADTRTAAQKRTLVALLRSLRADYPGARIVGHRDLSPDVNGNGRVDKWERTKECPCFDAAEEYADL